MSICRTVAMYLKKKKKKLHWREATAHFFPALPFSKFVLFWGFGFFFLMWLRITQYCIIRRVQKSVTISLRLVLSLSQLIPHTLVSKSINKDVKQMPAGWERFVMCVWISTWPVPSLVASVCCGCRGWFFHCAVLLQEPFKAVAVRKNTWISFTSCPFLWSLAYFPLD